MNITIHTPAQAVEAHKYIASMNRVFLMPNNMLHFYKATRCENCDCKAEEANPVNIGATTYEASTAIQKLVKANNVGMKKAKNEPEEIWHNEETGLCVCSDCDNALSNGITLKKGNSKI